MEFAQPPPDMPMGPTFNMPPPHMGGGHNNYHHGPRHFNSMGMGGHHQPRPFFRPQGGYQNRGPGGIPITQDDFDGKRLRKSVMRKTVDYNASIVNALEVHIRNFQPRSISF